MVPKEEGEMHGTKKARGRIVFTLWILSHPHNLEDKSPANPFTLIWTGFLVSLSTSPPQVLQVFYLDSLPPGSASSLSSHFSTASKSSFQLVVNSNSLSDPPAESCKYTCIVHLGSGQAYILYLTTTKDLIWKTDFMLSYYQVPVNLF